MQSDEKLMVKYIKCVVVFIYTQLKNTIKDCEINK
jgi:hypothetical protein